MPNSADYFPSPRLRRGDIVLSDMGAMFIEWNKHWPAMRQHNAASDCEKLKRRAAGTELAQGRPRKESGENR